MKIPLLMLLFLGSAQAAPILIATSQDGASITLHDEAGPCLGEAKLAVWQSADAKQRIPGCYKVGSQGVYVVFLDGDMATIPLQLLRKPTSL